MSRQPEITLIQLARLGDLSQTYPLIRALQTTYGVDSVRLAVDERVAQAAALFVGRSNVVALPLNRLLGGFVNVHPAEGVIERLREYADSLRADIVINLNYALPSSALAEAIPARYRLGARWRDVKAGFPSDAPIAELFNATQNGRHGRRHLSDIWLTYAREAKELLGEAGQSIEHAQNQGAAIARTLAMEVVTNSKLRELPLTPEPVIIVPGAGLEARRWSEHSFTKLASRLATRYPVILTGTASENDVAKRIIAGTHDTRYPIVSACGKLDLLELAALLHHARLVIGVDTGALNYSAAIGTKCLGIYYGSMNFRETGPYGDGNQVIVPDSDSYPCHERDMEAQPHLYFNSIPAEPVIQTAEAISVGEDSASPSGTLVYRSALTDAGLTWIQVHSHEPTEVQNLAVA